MMVAGIVQRDDFAVDHGIVRQSGQSLRDTRVPPIEIFVVARAELRPPILFEADRPISVQFELISPGGSFGQAAFRKKQHRFDERSFSFC